MSHDPNNPYHLPPGTRLAHIMSVYQRDGEHLIFMMILLKIARDRLLEATERLAHYMTFPDIDPGTLQTTLIIKR